MKRFSFLSLFIFASIYVQAQANVAMQLVKANAAALALSPDQVENSIVSDSYFNTFAGTHMVYLQQAYLGLPVYNKVKVLAFKNGELVSQMGEFLRTDKIPDPGSAQPLTDPAEAIKQVLSLKNAFVPADVPLTSIPGRKIKFDAGKLNIAFENITAELMWFTTEEGYLKLAWQVYFVPANASDYWLIRVDAKNQQLLEESNLTVYCSFATPHGEHLDNCRIAAETSKLHLRVTGSSMVQTANYLVIPFPAESPSHPGGSPATRTNPWSMAPGNATTLGWHNNGTTDYTSTRGNNVYAQEDRDNNNNTFGLSAISTSGPDPLNFNFSPDFTVSPLQTSPVENQQFNVTNLFYWNNIVHDLSYLYGFDEAAGNFQQDNLGRGGTGNDYVIADAQDAGGTSNANFSTPADGSRPRMQMFLWSGSPQKDGDVDNGVIVHEYGHGISNRLTGGPSNASCLQNGEQMGEGWSDYYSLMFTQDWATSTLTTGFTTPRSIGTYVSNQLPTGTGIRTQRYCTNFAVNNRVYTSSLPTSAHSRGEIWCATLWDMTWNIINQVGAINPNIHNTSAAGGNSIALKLVTEGMKLQPCSPGFISGRDAILQADRLLYGGLYSCAIKEAFRRRGMGPQASQGSSGSVTDQVPDFSEGGTVTLTQGGMTQVPEGQNITYTNTITSACNALAGFILRDTLPLNVSYVSGGTYNATNRVVSFPVAQAAGATQSFNFTVNVNNGSYFTPIVLLDEQVLTAALPAPWSATSVPVTSPWRVSEAFSVSAPYSFYVENLTAPADQKLELVSTISLPPSSSPRLSFSHRFNTEAGWDGGVVELSIDGSTWTDLGSRMISGGYNGTLGAAPTNALSNRSAFTGTISSFMQTAVNLSDFAGQQVKIRFRFGSDDNTSAPSGLAGWFIDNILLSVNPVVNMRSALYNAANVRVSISDTLTVITPAAGCTGVTITNQPVAVTACTGNNASFSITTFGSGGLLQWQTSIDGGNTWSDIAGATTDTYILNNITPAMNGFQYRVVVRTVCPTTVISNPATLTVSAAAAITAQPISIDGCPGNSVTFSGTAAGSGLTYQWQTSTDGGSVFTNIPGAINSSYTTPLLTNIMNGDKYRLRIASCGSGIITSDVATVTVLSALVVSQQPADVTSCSGNDVLFSTSGTGAAVTYQWQVSSDGGTSYINLPGETNALLTLSNININQNGFRYRAVMSSSCGSANSNAGILSVQSPVTILQQPTGVTACEGSPVNYFVAASGNATNYQWQVSTNGGPYSNLVNAGPYGGVNSSSLQITGITTTLNGNRYRAIVSGISCAGITSSPALLEVYTKPLAILQLQGPANLLPGLSSKLTVNAIPTSSYIYQWYRNGVLVPNITGSTLEVTVDNTGEYNVVITDENRCAVTSNALQTGFQASDLVFIYPNPNRGIFQVRMFNTINDVSPRIIIIYDSKGAMVYRKSYPSANTYDRMDVTMPNAASGVYMLEIRNANGKRLATSKVLLN